MAFAIRFAVIWHGRLGDQSVCWCRAAGWIH
jgi:hypothetical protein